MIVRLPHSHSMDQDEGRARARVFGEEASGLYPGQAWGQVEQHMADDWSAVRGSSPLSWDEVRNDVHAAWQVAKLDRDGCLRDHAPVKLPE